MAGCVWEQMTETGIEVITKQIPKELDAMEALRHA